MEGPLTWPSRSSACAAAPRTALAAAARGVEELAALVGKRLGREPRLIGTLGEPRDAGHADDLRDSRGCLLEAGGQVDDALSGGNFPVLLAGDCSIGLTTLPIVLGHRPDAVVLWLDAHGDYNTPETSESDYLGGMSLAGACGEWESGLTAAAVPTRPRRARRRARPRLATSARRSSDPT